VCVCVCERERERERERRVFKEEVQSAARKTRRLCAPGQSSLDLYGKKRERSNFSTKRPSVRYTTCLFGDASSRRSFFFLFSSSLEKLIIWRKRVGCCSSRPELRSISVRCNRGVTCAS